MMETIYVALLDRGVESWRPVQAQPRAGGLFQIVSKNDDPEDENWQFPSGSLVRCMERQLADGPRLVAVELMPTTGLKVVR